MPTPSSTATSSACPSSTSKTGSGHHRVPLRPSPLRERAGVRVNHGKVAPTTRQSRSIGAAHKARRGKDMATHFFGLKDRTFYHSHAIGRNEFAGTGFRNPVDMAIASDGSVYVVNRSYENRPDGVHMTVVHPGRGIHLAPSASTARATASSSGPPRWRWTAEDNVYVADEWLNRITKHHPRRRIRQQVGNRRRLRRWRTQRPVRYRHQLPRQDDCRRQQEQPGPEVHPIDGQFISSFGSEGSGRRRVQPSLGHRPGQATTTSTSPTGATTASRSSTADGEWQQSIGESGDPASASSTGPTASVSTPTATSTSPTG